MLNSNSHTTALFHYTKNQTALLSILRNGLKLSFCKEKFTDNLFAGIPMISFCDIPIGNSVEHASKYGRYAIGLSKDFMIKEYSYYLGPVNYFISDNSIRAAFKLKEEAQIMRQELDDLSKHSTGSPITLKLKGKTLFQGKTLNQKDTFKALKLFTQSHDYYRSATFAIGLMKRYASKHNGKLQINYDECEWRMVMPENTKPQNGEICKWFWNEQEYDAWRQSTNDKFVPNWNLQFSVDDIMYIIVPTRKCIQNFVKQLTKLDTIGGTALSTNDIYSLTSKVISLEQIREDF